MGGTCASPVVHSDTLTGSFRQKKKTFPLAADLDAHSLEPEYVINMTCAFESRQFKGICKHSKTCCLNLAQGDQFSLKVSKTLVARPSAMRSTRYSDKTVFLASCGRNAFEYPRVGR